MPIDEERFQDKRLLRDPDSGAVFVAGEIVVRGDGAAAVEAALSGTGTAPLGLTDQSGSPFTSAEIEGLDGLSRLTFTLPEIVDGETDVDDLARHHVALVRAANEGADVPVAQLEHVFFLHGRAGCGCGGDGCGPHPADVIATLAGPASPPGSGGGQGGGRGGGGAGADPFRSNPFRSNPFRSNPFRSNPFRTNPFRTNPFRTNPNDRIDPKLGPEAPKNSAEPAAGQEFPKLAATFPGPRVLVLDTGLAEGTLPEILADAVEQKRLFGDDQDRPDLPFVDAAGHLHQVDGFLDPVAGHGTFIAGIIEQLAPGCTIEVREHVSRLGHVREVDVAVAIAQALARPENREEAKDDEQPLQPHIISMSFGGPVLDTPFLVHDQIVAAHAAGVAVVASAGNDADCRPYYPAAWSDEVVGVAAMGPDGPAPFTNFGPWVRACAAGADLVSTFFHGCEAGVLSLAGGDVAHFRGWARWSGTSFAAPVVVAALVRAMVEGGDVGAREAVARVVDAPYQPWLPALGTVVSS